MKQTVVVCVVGLFTGCLQDKSMPTGPEGRLALAVAPLSLDGVSDACYSLAVFSGAPSGTPVWERTHVCASRFGDGAGALTYVGTCDASYVGASSVRLVMEDLCSGGPCPATAGGVNSLAASEWRNPCPAPTGCVQEATCRENADVPVTFDLTIARAAKQGFFDVAVGFEDIFCSAKADCVDDAGAPLTLLHDPADQRRKDTVVVAWACTAGPGETTSLYYDNVVLRCFDGDRVIGEWAYDPSLGQATRAPVARPSCSRRGSIGPSPRPAAS